MALTIRHAAKRTIDQVGNALLAPPVGGLSGYCNHGPRTQRLLALTFDDGPSAGSTDEILDVLGELGAPSTFFCVGRNVDMNPDLVARAAAEGHVIGGHSDDHGRRGSLSVRDIGHIDRVEQSITAVLGKRPLLYRPPWGWLTPWEARRLRSRGYHIVGWDVYTLDWQVPEVDPVALADRAVADCRPGSFLLFHDGNPLQRSWTKRVTAAAVRRLVPRLQDDGYRFVTVPEVLGVEAYAAPSSALTS